MPDGVRCSDTGLAVTTTAPVAAPTAALHFDGRGEEGAMAYPLKQMLKSAQLIRHEQAALEPEGG